MRLWAVVWAVALLGACSANPSLFLNQRLRAGEQADGAQVTATKVSSGFGKLVPSHPSGITPMQKRRSRLTAGVVVVPGEGASEAPPSSSSQEAVTSTALQPASNGDAKGNVPAPRDVKAPDAVPASRQQADDSASRVVSLEKASPAVSGKTGASGTTVAPVETASKEQGTVEPLAEHPASPGAPAVAAPAVAGTAASEQEVAAKGGGEPARARRSITTREEWRHVPGHSSARSLEPAPKRASGVKTKDVPISAPKAAAHQQQRAAAARTPVHLIEAAQQHDSQGPAEPSTLAPTQAGDEFPVDFVFTWYNAADEASNAERLRLMTRIHPERLPSGGVSAKRFADAGELRFALRSVEKYAPWVNRVFVVVADNQPPPDWLVAGAEGTEGGGGGTALRIVRHSEIFPDPSVLPTFNSFAIEACLHRIPGLAEHFVYLNDDMFLNAPVGKDLFFDLGTGKPNVWVWRGEADPARASASENSYASGIFKGVPTAGDDSYVAAIKNSNRLTDQLLDSLPANMHGLFPGLRDHSLIHQAKALSKAWMLEAEKHLPEAFSAVRRSTFRQRDNVWSVQVATMLCVQLGGCNRAHNPKDEYISFEWMKPAKMVSKIQESKPVLFCINDSSGDASAVKDFQASLARLFPQPSSFEKQQQ